MNLKKRGWITAVLILSTLTTTSIMGVTHTQDSTSNISFISVFDDRSLKSKYENTEKEIIASLDGKAEVFDLFENKSLGIFDGEIRFDSFKPHFAKTLICKKI